MLNRNGIERAPERSKRTRWPAFPTAHWKVFAAGDFLAAEVWTGRGLVTEDGTSSSLIDSPIL